MHDNGNYSPLSIRGLMACMAGLAACGAFVFPSFVVVGIGGLLLGAWSLPAIRRFELRGTRLAVGGMAISAVCVVAAPVWHFQRFASEAPADCARIDFDRFASVDVANHTSGLDRLLGSKVCLKGYVRDSRFEPVDWTHDEADWPGFVLTPTGFLRQPSQAVILNIPTDAKWVSSADAYAVSGTLERNPAHAKDKSLPEYRIANPTVRPARTPFQLSSRMRNGDC